MTDSGEKEIVPGPGAAAYSFDAREFPWWLVGMLVVIGLLATAILFDEHYQEAFGAILPLPANFLQGLAVTLYLTVGSFVVAIFLGLFIGLARMSRNTVTRHLAAFYIEFIRGVPVLVFIFLIALVVSPDFASLINVESRSIPQALRASAALSLFYAAFIAEVFRAGIQSVPRSQSEAGRSIGLSESQITWKVVLPQAVRNMLPALGNDLISLMKDTSLVSVLAVREITQMARLYSGSTFRIRESFYILVIMYVILTLSLSLLLRWYERRIAIPR
jgi:polar amino acid transport system permease protein